ncbi:MAG: ATP-binding protein [Lentisphaeria bacterium]|nr:ATP-binding protein [Lentisphaeria bacterium]
MPPSNFSFKVISGPEEGKVFPLGRDIITIGRSSMADIFLNDHMLSRKHIQLRFEEQGWMIEDLNSTNGTWITGDRLYSEQFLPPEVTVRIGSTIFTIIDEEDINVLQLDEKLIAHKVAPLGGEQMTMEMTETQPRMQPPGNSEQQRLSAIYELQGILGTEQDVSTLNEMILKVVTNYLPADYSFILLPDQSVGGYIPVSERSLNKAVPIKNAHLLSSTILEYVISENEAIISIDTVNDERFQGASIAEQQLNSVMCAPMVGSHGIAGIIYLVSPQTKRKYTVNDLQFLNIMCHAAGMAIENMNLFEKTVESQRMAAIGTTAASLSHYVKNILNGLEGSVSLLRMGIDSKDMDLMDQSWDILSKNHKRLSTLVLDLLNLAKEDKVSIARYNLSEIILETVDLVRKQLEESNIEIRLGANIRSLEVTAFLDSQGIHRVVLNIIQNAMDSLEEKFLSATGGYLDIQLSHVKSSNEICIEITDNGVGIKKEDIGKVFENFHTGKGSRGTGLGLAVSKRIINGHKGRVEIESEYGQFCRFKVYLPQEGIEFDKTLELRREILGEDI